jgi:hypothetical protein
MTRSADDRPGEPGGTAVDPDLPLPAVDPEVLDEQRGRWTPLRIAVWVGVALLGGLAWVMIALVRGETVNAIWFVFAAVCTYFIAYRFYSTYIEKRITQPDDRRATPAEYKEDGQDYMPMDRRVLYGHHSPRSPAPAAGRAGSRRTVGLPARHAVDHRGRHPGRGGAGLPGAVLLDAPRRPLAGPDGARRTGPRRWWPP